MVMCRQRKYQGTIFNGTITLRLRRVSDSLTFVVGHVTCKQCTHFQGPPVHLAWTWLSFPE